MRVSSDNSFRAAPSEGGFSLSMNCFCDSAEPTRLRFRSVLSSLEMNGIIK